MAAPFSPDDQDVVDLRWPDFSQPLADRNADHNLMIADLKRALADLIEYAGALRDLDTSLAQASEVLLHYGA